MKTGLILALLGCGTATALAQGTVNFANIGAGLNAPIEDDSRVKLTTAGNWDVGLYVAGPDGNWSAVAIDQSVAFIVPGYFNGGVQSVPGIAGGTQATFEVVAWSAVGGNTPYAALATSFSTFLSVQIGASFPFTVTLGSSSSHPADLVGMGGFSLQDPVCLSCPPVTFLQPLPEPSTLTLSALAAALVVGAGRQRRKFGN